MTAVRFDDLDLSAEMLATLEGLGYDQPTAVQRESLPGILAGRDLQAKAETGSGKTAAFGIGIIEQLDPMLLEPQALVIAPTRELCQQITESLRALGKGIANLRVVTLAGGSKRQLQQETLAQGCHLVVGTPGRINDLLEREDLDLSSMRQVVLDEADRMLDMGFAPQLGEIVGYFPEVYQSLLFSATYNEAVQGLAEALTDEALQVEVEPEYTAENLKQLLCRIKDDERLEALHALLVQHQFRAAMVFCNSKQMCHEVRNELRLRGHSADSLHGDMEQREREDTLVKFANGSTTVLVATDVAARGLDIEAVPGVINYEVPMEPATYVHRIGRTARAGEKGTAITLCANSEHYRWQRIVEEQGDETAPLIYRPALDKRPVFAEYCTLLILGGRRHKLRPGDLVGALTRDGQLEADQIGKIQVSEQYSYVAVRSSEAKAAAKWLNDGKIKGKKYRVRML